jgi:lipoate-protein ligase A
MAVDEALLEACAGDPERTLPTLRLYGWDPPAVSLGRSQQEFPAGLAGPHTGVDLVRRPTGGGAVLHDRERTYAVVAPLDRPPFDRGVVETYRCISGLLLAALGRLGIEAEAPPAPGPPPRRREAPRSCFDAVSAHEIVAAGAKLVGSAQARRARAFLQHGSIPLVSDPDRVAGHLGALRSPERHGDLARVLGRQPSAEAVDAALVEAFESGLGIRLSPGQLSEREALRVAQLRCWKYDSASWTFEGRIGERERRYGPRLPA